MKRILLIMMCLAMLFVVTGCSSRSIITSDGARYSQTDLFTKSEVTDFHVDKTGEDWSAGFSKASRSVDESLAKTLEINARVLEKFADKVPDPVP